MIMQCRNIVKYKKIIHVVDHTQKVLNAAHNNIPKTLINCQLLYHNKFNGRLRVIYLNVTKMIRIANISVATIFPNLRKIMIPQSVVLKKEMFALAHKKVKD